MAGRGTEEGTEIMKRIAFVALGVVIGFSRRSALLPAAHGANDMSTYRQLDLFSEAFDTRAQELRASGPGQRAHQRRDRRHGQRSRSAFELHGREGLRRHADPDQGRVRRRRHRSDDGRRPDQGDLADRRHARRQGRHEDRRLHRRHRRHLDPGHSRSTTPSTRCAGRRLARSRSRSCARARRSRST